MPTSISFAAFFYSSYCPALTLQRCLTHICTSIGVSEISISHFIFSFFPPSCSSSCFCLSFFAFLLYSLPSHHSSRINIWAQLFCLCQALRAGQHIEATKFILSIPLLYVSLHRENFKTYPFSGENVFPPFFWLKEITGSQSITADGRFLQIKPQCCTATAGKDNQSTFSTFRKERLELNSSLSQIIDWD